MTTTNHNGGDPRLPRFQWDVADFAPRDHLVAFPTIHPLLIQLLWNRGLRHPDEIGLFLDSGAAPLASPWSMKGMADAVDRILRAKQRNEIIAVFGDYDVDGVSATALLVECLRCLGVEPLLYLPRREPEGYGLNREAIGRLHALGVGLIVCVDCGISAESEVDHARSLGLDVVVTDHHHVPKVLPRAVAVLNPHQPGCDYPFKLLCGVGIADRLARALLEKSGLEPSLADQWLDLVALGTIADVVSLTGENRTLVIRGLTYLNPPARPGLRALVERAGLATGPVTPMSIGFGLAPRLNAAGRLDDAMVSLRLLLSRSADEARDLAGELDAANRERQRLTTEALTHARTEIQRRQEESTEGLPRLLVVADERYRQGIVGLVAARLVEEFGRPVLVAELRDNLMRGSARSIGTFHVTEALSQCSDLLVRYGGHAKAAGFTVASSRFEEFQRRLEAIGRAEIADDALIPRLQIDTLVSLRRFDQNLPDLLDRLEPFGCDNPRPVFLSRRVRVLEGRVVGQDSPGHLKLKLADAHTRWDAIGFRLGDRQASLAEYVDIVYSVERDDWNGRRGTQLRLLDFQSSIAQG